jgi:pyruvate/2-oxoglutarate/acetoin dehydrogenase E1 component
LRIRIFTVGLLSALLISGCNIINVSKPAPNNNPLIESVTCTNDVMALADNEMVCQASDPNGDSLQYEWSTGDGKIIGTGARMMWVSPDTMGNYDVAVRVSDGKGGEAIETVPIRVLTNADGTTAQPITLNMLLNSPAVVSENSTLKVGTATKITCAVANAAGKKLSYEWAASGGKLKGTGIDEKTCTVVFWTAPPLTQEYTVTVIARDEQGNEARGQVMFDVFCCPRN